MLGATYNNYEANYASQAQNVNIWESDDTRGSQQINSFLAKSSDKQGSQHYRGRGYNEGYR